MGQTFVASHIFVFCIVFFVFFTFDGEKLGCFCGHTLITLFCLDINSFIVNTNKPNMHRYFDTVKVAFALT